jgi:hypothetical protein
MDHKQSELHQQTDPVSPGESSEELNEVPPDMDGPKRKQSGLGIASFILGLLCIIGLLIAAVTIASSLSDYLSPDGTVISEDALQTRLLEDSGMILSVFLFIASLGLGVVGLILGIVGLVMRNRRKVFALIGTILNGLVIAGFVGIVLFGLAMQGTLS